jgi:adenylate cyclase
LQEGTRRLAAIMFTDLVGYSKISSLDERRALKLLEDHRNLLQPIFEKYQGTVVKTLGDGFLVEFASAVEAVNCAVQAQNEIRHVNERRRENERALARIGIHVGDVVHSGGDILGDAVNVAARLQPLANAGGICVTRQVVDQVQGRVHYKMNRLGVRELKNIQHPVELFTVEVPKRLTESEEPTLDPRRIAILPFANLSADPNDRYFADGMTEELISTVSRIGELSVISRTSVMRYKDTIMPIGDIGRELSAGSLLEGSVRKAGNKVRITTQLIDAKNDKHLWAQSYDRDLTDIFAIQGDIAEQVAGALKVKLLSKEKEALEQQPTNSPESYSLYLKGRYLWNERTRDSVRKAIRYFEEAIARDPRFAQALVGLADCYLVLIDQSFMDLKEGGPKVRSLLDKALEANGRLAEAHASLGNLHVDEWDWSGAEAEFKRAIELNPNYATAHQWYSILLSVTDREEEGIAEVRLALSLDPASAIVNMNLANQLLSTGRFDEAIKQYNRTLALEPKFGLANVHLGGAYVSASKFDEGLAELVKAREILGDSPWSMAFRGYARGIMGDLEAAREAVRDLERTAKTTFVPDALIGAVCFAAGDKEKALSLFEKAFEERSNVLPYIKVFAVFRQIRADPKFGALLQRVGHLG